jgi:hypothetical protein
MSTMGELSQIYLARGRYLRSMPEDALSERLVHFLNNCVRLDRNSMVQLCALESPDMFTRLMDVLAETGLRHGRIVGTQPREVWDRTRNVMIQPSAETAERAKRLEARIPTTHNGLLFRFSKYQHMEELLDAGGLLFQFASSFRDQEGLAVRDDELRLEFDRYLSADEAASIACSSYSPGNWDGTTKLSVSLECPDFLTLCLTDTVNYRMISDWRAEAAIIIHDPTEFGHRLAKGAQHLLGKTRTLESGKVYYIDPYFPLTSKDVPFCKHFRFAYQREFRFVIRIPEAVEFGGRKLWLGSLADIATLVDLR